ncbi:fungal-specific transcription factor domain-containing protein [Sporodiniella umbellata]|nr:fungal-specific transcription factor domain-containing protein [Sporodiniella umbellata]
MEALLTHLTNKSIQEMEANDFAIESRAQCTPKYTSDDDDSSFDDDDDDELEEEEERARSLRGGTSSMEEAIANLNSEDYDSIKYTGLSAGIRLENNDLFKTASYVPCPGRQDVALKIMPQKELLVVQANASSLSGKYTRLDVGFSLTSSIFDTKRDTPHALHLTPGSLTHTAPLTSCIKKAIDLYFTHIHKFLPIVNKSTFEAGDTKSGNNILVQAVLAVAFRFASRHFPKQFKKANVYADAYFRKVMARLQDSYRARLRHVQASLLVTLYLDMDEADVESMQWFMLGKAIRMAQDIGLHRSCHHWNLPRSEIETRHRVFFACYVLDRFMGARAGKPLTILDRDFDTDFPVPHEVFDQAHSPGPPVYHGFLALIKLSELLGRILKALYAPSSKKSNDNANLDHPTILDTLDLRLKDWKQKHLSGVSQAEKANLLLFYYTVMLLLHRPFIESSLHQDALATKSRQACETAACNIMVIVKQKQSFMTDPDSYAPFCLPTSFVYSMFQSCLIHLVLVLQNRDSLLRLKRLQCAIVLLKSYGEQLASAQRAHRILSTLITIHHIHLADPISAEDQDQFSHLQEDLDLVPKSPTLQLMPKATYYQRMMNTSIIGGITPTLQNPLLHPVLPEPIFQPEDRLYPRPNLEALPYPTVYSHPDPSSSSQSFAYDLNYPTSPIAFPPHLHWADWHDPAFQDQRTFLPN